jgi:hypothetical protein
MMRLNSIQKEPHRASLGYANSEVDPCQDSRHNARNYLFGLKPNWSTPSEPPQVSNVKQPGTHYPGPTAWP